MSLEFQKIPFYDASETAERPRDLRLFRPVFSANPAESLNTFYENAIDVLSAHGFTPDDVTLQLPNKYEVTIVSKGSINRAVTQTKDEFFANVQTQSIEEVLLGELPGTSKRPIPATLGKISYYGTELGEKTKVPRYLAAFLDMDSENVSKYVGLERFAGYEWLKAYSGLDRLFTLKLRSLKPAAFRFAAFHNPGKLPTADVIEALKPSASLRVELGRVVAAGFDEK